MPRIHLWPALGLTLALASTTACGGITVSPDATPVVIVDAATIDAMEQPVDAMIDAVDAPPPPLMAPPGQDLTPTAGRMTGVTFTLDVQLGHPFSQQQIQGSQFRLEGNSPIKP